MSYVCDYLRVLPTMDLEFHTNLISEKFLGFLYCLEILPYNFI